MTNRITDGNPRIPVSTPALPKVPKKVAQAAMPAVSDIVESGSNASSENSPVAGSPVQQGLKTPQKTVPRAPAEIPPDRDSDEDGLEPFVLNPKAFFNHYPRTYIGGCPVDDDEG